MPSQIREPKMNETVATGNNVVQVDGAYTVANIAPYPNEELNRNHVGDVFKVKDTNNFPNGLLLELAAPPGAGMHTATFIRPTIVSIAPDYVRDDPAPLIAEAHTYFTNLGLAEGDSLDPNIQDSDGLVSYIVAASNPPPPEIQELYDEIAPVMEGLTNVVVSAVLKQAGTDANKKHDPNTWKAPMQAMVKAFCSGFSLEEKHYNQEIAGISVASKFLNILINAVASQGAAFSSFVKFLQSQGETMRLEKSSGSNKYLYACVSITHEIFQAADGRWIYVPKFKSYFTQFSQETFKLTSACASYDKFKFAFDLEVMTGAFMVANWKSSKSFRDQVKAFIEKFQKANIEDSTNYFDGIFNSGQPTES